MKYWSTVLTVLLVLAGFTFANREHKVHNIVLYPHRHSWCSTRNISQVISYPGCKQVTIDNNVCVGACFSYSIPHTEPSDPGEVIGPYCDSCQPSETSWHNVTLDCSENSSNNGDEEDKPAFLVKRVQIITNCSCASCEKQTHKKHHHHHQHHHQEQQQNPVSSTTSSLIHDDIPELLEVVPYSENDTDPVHHSPVHHGLPSENHVSSYIQQHQLNHYEHNSHTENVKKLLHQKITALIQSIQETDSKQDREQLAEMIKLIKGSSDRNWDTLVQSLQSENSILDLDRLRSELEVEQEEDQIVVEEHKSLDQEDNERLLKHQFDIFSHHPHGQPHHHVAGERLDQHHHLERGPHGALVIASDDDKVSQLNHGYEITEKMNILPHQLKPNHAGAVLSYDNHHSERGGRTGEHHHGGAHHRSGQQ